MLKIILYVLAAIVALYLAILAWSLFVLNTTPIASDETQSTRAERDITVLTQALWTYSMDAYVFPSNEEGLQALVERPDGVQVDRYREGGYIQGGQLPVDPWGNPYQYRLTKSPEENYGTFKVFSFGPDGTESDDDIHYWRD